MGVRSNPMRSLIVALVLLLAACASSPPTRFYTLDPVPARVTLPASGLTLQVAAVHIPGVLDRQEMVRESSPERLQLSDRNRWGAPLAEMMRRVLAQDLAARLPGSTVLPPETVPPAGTRVLAVDVQRFDAGPSGKIRLEGSWSELAAPSGKPLLTRHVRLTAPAQAGGYRGQAKAMSLLLGRLADRIASSLAH